MLNLIDEHSRECLMIRSERRWSSARVIEALADVMVMKGVPEQSSIRQRAGVRGPGLAQMACSHRSEDGLHRAGKSMGERLLRKLQLKAAG